MGKYNGSHFEEILEIFCLAAGGSAFSVRMDDDFTLLYGDDSYYRMHEYTKESILKRIENKCVRYIHPDDVEHVRSHCTASVEAQEKRIEWEMRIITGKGKVKYVKCAGTTALLEGEPVMHGFVLDITENKKLKEENAFSEGAIQVAMQQTGISFWSYNLDARRITQDRNSRKAFGFESVVENVPDCFWGTGVIHPNDEDSVKAMYEELFSGASTAKSVARWKNPDNGEYWWAEIAYTLIPGVEEEARRAVGSAVDVSERIDLQKKYDSAMSYKGIVDENALGSFRLNLSLNLCGEGRCLYPDVLRLQEDGTADGFCRRFLADIPDEENREKFQRMFSRKALMEGFAQGMSHLSIEHRFRMEGDRFRWVKTHVNVVKNPVTGDIEAFFYAFDIDRTKMLQLLMEHTMKSDYDYVALIGVFDERHRDVVDSTGGAIGSPESLGKHTDIIESYARCVLVPDDCDRFVRENALPLVLRNLKTAGSYAVAYRVFCKDGTMGYKRARYSYLSGNKDQIAFSVTDITQEMEAEQKRNELLGSALTAAKQANSAKTDFLSRMSHEIRTPMNAIIGMTAVMAQSMGDEAQLENCISKIGMSSRFLLSLINDILDMSRIESGKVLLKSERIPFAEFVGSINSICYAQAQARDIDYECMVDGSVEDAYIGDAMKLQQVLINILSNAIKFTSAGGRVSIDIQQIKKSERNATLRFSINDTGCGIEDEFIPLLFEPFSQGHSGSTAMYGGTGLGLAICKNLVELMDGKIEVRSIVGVGSEFSVTVKLGVTEETKVVPIIAMTANAFDDDVEKSRKVGMNAHLAKPIEPEQLYRTLYHHIFNQEEEAR
ncbi:MAG: ATP-binding protein [Gordonibacter sp.]|nr:ATP-binding protein [Gordonibacter sp.]